LIDGEGDLDFFLDGDGDLDFFLIGGEGDLDGDVLKC